MNSPTKNLTRSLRGLLYPQAKEQAYLAEGLSAWVGSEQIDESTQVVKGFLRQVAIIRHQRQNVRAQFKQLELLLKKADPHIAELMALLDKSRLPLSNSDKEIATTVDSLLKAFAQSYYELAETLGGKWFRLLHSRQSPLASLRAAQMIHRRSLLAYLVYSNGSPQRWKQYQALLAMNEEASANDPATPSGTNSATESLSRTIVQSCLLSLSDPTRLREEDLARTRSYIERYGHLATLRRNLPESVDEKTPGIFVLSDSSRGPQKLKSEYEDLRNCHILDTRPLIQKLNQQILDLKAGASPTHLGLPAAATDPAYLLLLIQCKDLWSFTRQRRHPRNGVRPRADLVSGFDDVYRLVAQKALMRRKSDAPGQDMALPTSEWSIVDQSEGGFGLRFIKGDTGSISVGEIVALCFKEHASLAICITRRARNISGAEFEIGLEILAERAFATQIPAHPKGVETQTAAQTAETIPAILLPRLMNDYNGPGILLPTQRPSHAKIELSVRSNGSAVHLETERQLEYFPSCELMAMRPVRDEQPIN